MAIQLTETINCKPHFVNSTVVKKHHTPIHFNQVKFLSLKY